MGRGEVRQLSSACALIGAGARAVAYACACAVACAVAPLGRSGNMAWHTAGTASASWCSSCPSASPKTGFQTAWPVKAFSDRAVSCGLSGALLLPRKEPGNEMLAGGQLKGKPGHLAPIKEVRPRTLRGPCVRPGQLNEPGHRQARRKGQPLQQPWPEIRLTCGGRRRGGFLPSALHHGLWRRNRPATNRRQPGNRLASGEYPLFVGENRREAVHLQEHISRDGEGVWSAARAHSRTTGPPALGVGGRGPLGPNEKAPRCVVARGVMQPRTV